MAIAGVTIHAAVLATLIRVCRKPHPHIGAFHFIYKCLWKNLNVICLVFICFFAFRFTEIQKIIQHLVAVFEETVVHIFLGATAFNGVFGHKKTLKKLNPQS